MRSGLVLACAAFAAIVSDALAFAPGAALPSLAGRVAPNNCLLGLDMMRHGNRKNKLALPADQRKALLRGLTTEIIRHGRITTTLARAKAVRGEPDLSTKLEGGSGFGAASFGRSGSNCVLEPLVDRMIGLAKDGSLSSRRAALGWMYDKELVHSLFEAAPERYGTREGGYVRVLRTLNRQGDNAKMGVIELV